MEKWVNDGRCFACGPKNPIGLKLQFSYGNGEAWAEWTPRPEFQGYRGVLHGGIVATLLDEAMAHAVGSLGVWGATVSLQVRFRKAAPVDQPLQVYSRVVEQIPRGYRAKAVLRNLAGDALATAEGVLLKVGVRT